MHLKSIRLFFLTFMICGLVAAENLRVTFGAEKDLAVAGCRRSAEDLAAFADAVLGDDVQLRSWPDDDHFAFLALEVDEAIGREGRGRIVAAETFFP